MASAASNPVTSNPTSVKFFTAAIPAMPVQYVNESNICNKGFDTQM